MAHPSDPRWKVAAPTAEQTYKQRQREIRALVQELDKQLEQHTKEQKLNPMNWGHAGDLGHVAEKLSEIVEFLKGYK